MTTPERQGRRETTSERRGLDGRGVDVRIDEIAGAVRDEFESTRRLLSFDEWLSAFLTHPRRHARSAAEYVRDAFDYFGTRTVRTPRGTINRFVLFDQVFGGAPRLVGQEEAQNRVYEAIDGFVRLGRVNRFLLLHGPNGSAKSTLLEAIQRALEVYSTVEEGALYRFAWVFPNKRIDGGGIGFGSSSKLRDALGGTTFARLGGDDIDARVTDENKDHPLLLLPQSIRARLLAEVSAQDPDFVASESILHGELTQRNRRIYDALLASQGGDLRKVLQHVQVERLFLSRQYRTGLVTVEPKQTVDARSFPVTGDQAYGSLPPSVMGQVLFAAQGELVDANRGVMNFSDLLKRPYEQFKYLLTATESGHVALDHIMLRLDMLLLGSANDLNLLEFRALRPGEYPSFRARLELIRVPFLLDYRVERKIYQEQVGDLLRGVKIAPHVPMILALWGVMSRLRRPNAEAYTKELHPVIQRMTPLEKADLYSYGRVPRGLSSEEARLLLSSVPQMYQEAFPQAIVRADGQDHVLGDYEGSFGSSVRDLKGVLLAAAADPGVCEITVPRVFQELREYMRDSVNHRFMRLTPDGAFHRLEGPDSITQMAWERWLDLSDAEVRTALGLVDEARYMELFRRYVTNVSHFLKKERLYDPITGELRDADQALMNRLEKTMDPKAGVEFRADILSRIGAWALSHPDEEPAYDQIFPDYFDRLREDYYEQQKDAVRRSIQRMLEILAENEGEEARAASDPSLTAADEKKARDAIVVLLRGPSDASREEHTRSTLKEMLVELSKHRY